ncbi:sirohydrochlorin cobaltochelatase [Marinobacter daqiaonensis]|uniref:Sirohydrochlorin cobaltochelatase n=1 Tax=Marinobacter daqiaonensis TaxID=650891 RepID=A0A1I6GLW3_9GAMM|nr:CbiX/SirB N-terminal domain-containing protein [Marinobacter daqiaonensis]SFR43146.1 sirohydrochlorin cobaltochelatase [Marinobacter daqiaonensis]
MTAPTRILLLAHGSSDPRWCQTFEALAAPTLRTLPEARVAYMELAEPSLEAEVEKAAAEGVTHIKVVPLFLAVGRHLRKDVPAMLEDYRERFHVEVELLPPIGEDPRLGEALKDIVSDTLKA